MIKAIITDFDGTLVDTFEANFRAYKDAFVEIGMILTREQYHQFFGLRFDKFMEAVGIDDAGIANGIKELKKKYYPKYFSLLRPNIALINLIQSFKQMGGKTAIASTARKENLMKAINYINIANHFDLIFAGVDVKFGKPNPEIYLKTMEALQVIPEETLIFEDSQIGIDAAKASGAHYMVVDQLQFELS